MRFRIFLNPWKLGIISSEFECYGQMIKNTILLFWPSMQGSPFKFKELLLKGSNKKAKIKAKGSP
jgi:hypothetical protein